MIARRSETTLLVMVLGMLTVTTLSLWPASRSVDLRPSAVHTPDGRWLVQFTGVGIRVVDAATGAVRHRVEVPERGGVATFGHMLPGGAIAVRVQVRRSDGIGTVEWRKRLDPVAGTLEPDGASGPEPFGGFAADDGSYVSFDRAAGLHGSGSPYVYRPDGSRVTLKTPHRMDGEYRTFAFDDEARTLAGAWEMGTNVLGWTGPAASLTVWDARTGAVLRDGPALPVAPRALAVHRDGTVVCLADGSGTPGRQPGATDRLWLVRPAKEVREVSLPQAHAFGGMELSPDGRRLAVIATDRSRTSGYAARSSATSVLLHDLGDDRLVWRWPIAHLVGGMGWRFVGPVTLRVAFARTGRSYELDPATGAAALLYVTAPPTLVGRHGWFPTAATATLLVWVTLWLGLFRLRPRRRRADVAFAVAVLLPVAWVAARLLPEPVVLRSPTLWPLLTGWATGLFPRYQLLALLLATVPLVVSFASAAGWLNRRRFGRLAWLLTLTAFVVGMAAIDLDRLLHLDLLPPWLWPPWL